MGSRPTRASASRTVAARSPRVRAMTSGSATRMPGCRDAYGSCGTNATRRRWPRKRLPAQRGHLHAADPQRPAARRDQPDRDPRERALAGAARARQPSDLTAPHGQRHTARARAHAPAARRAACGARTSWPAPPPRAAARQARAPPRRRDGGERPSARLPAVASAAEVAGDLAAADRHGRGSRRFAFSPALASSTCQSSLARSIPSPQTDLRNTDPVPGHNELARGSAIVDP